MPLFWLVSFLDEPPSAPVAAEPGILAMSFLQPLLAALALPLALLPVIIHLIHLHRRRTVPWAAMMFLRAAQQMNRGFSRLRRWLILAFRMIAIAAILLTAARPLAGGWLGLTGGAPETVIVLLDRSASMEQQNLATGLSKREAGLRKLTDGIRDAYRGRTRLVLIDSAEGEPIAVENPEALTDLPSTWATDTEADVPALMQSALDYITTNQTGRTDVWLLSDLQQSDWDTAGGRWDPLRQGFAELPGVRFHLLCYPQLATDNLAVTVDNVSRRESREKAELVLDIEVLATHPDPSIAAGTSELPLRLVINGVTSVLPAEMRDGRVSLQGHRIPIDTTMKRGWGRIELPADSSPSDNAWHFVFDEPPILKSVIVSDDPLAMTPIQVALEAPLNPDKSYEAEILEPARAAEIPWDETALIVWQAPIPSEDDLVARQLEDHIAAGRTLVFLPPESSGPDTFQGVAWGEWQSIGEGEPESIDWWRNDSGPLANTRDGAALPVGEVTIRRRRELVSEDNRLLPLARMANKEPLLARATPSDTSTANSRGDVYFLATLPGTGDSTLARDGVVLFAFLHRCLDAGAGSLGKARQRSAGPGVLGDPNSIGQWKAVEEADSPGSRPGNTEEESAAANPTQLLPLRAGVLEAEDRLIALNRPTSEDVPDLLPTTTIEELFAGLDHRIIEETVEDESSLASEIWRTFLFLMAIALLLEAVLSMPQKRVAKPDAERGGASPPRSPESTPPKQESAPTAA